MQLQYTFWDSVIKFYSYVYQRCLSKYLMDSFLIKYVDLQIDKRAVPVQAPGISSESPTQRHPHHTALRITQSQWGKSKDTNILIFLKLLHIHIYLLFRDSLDCGDIKRNRRPLLLALLFHSSSSMICIHSINTAAWHGWRLHYAL